MKDVQRRYSTSKMEALAVNVATKNVRVHLLPDVIFTVVTDHQALQYRFITLSMTHFRVRPIGKEVSLLRMCHSSRLQHNS